MKPPKALQAIGLVLGGALLSAALLCASPQSASAATVTYLPKQTVAYGLWYYSDGRSSVKNEAFGNVSIQSVQVTNDTFTATGTYHVEQSYARAKGIVRCRWNGPSGYKDREWQLGCGITT